MGTTATGAIDDLSSLCSLAHDFDAWFHVDAAYGGFFALLDEVKSDIAGIELADSLSVDAHKGLFLPAATAILIVRNKNHLSTLNQVKAHYLDRDESDPNSKCKPDLSPLERAKAAAAAEAPGPHWSSSVDYSPELSRSFRGLHVWFSLLFHGTKFFEGLLREKRQIADTLYEQLLQIPDIEVGAAPQLSIVYFRFVRDRVVSDQYHNEVNKRVFSIVKDDGRVYFTTIHLDGKIWLRIAIFNYQSRSEHVQLALQLILEAHSEVEIGIQKESLMRSF